MVKIDVKDMAELHYFLGVKVVQDLKADRIWIGQPTYIQNLISPFNLQNTKPLQHTYQPKSEADGSK